MQPGRISIIGVGLLGGSIGLAAKAFLNHCEIVGYGHRRSTLQRALQIGAIDRAAENLNQAVEHADVVILCTPVLIFQQILQSIAGALPPESIVTDVGSTKRSVVGLGESLLPAGRHFVGSHPMAGSEKRGVEFARADLFQGALCITTPTPTTNPKALSAVEDLWSAIGMRTRRLSPDQHDQLLADISHLPHALAAALVAMQSEEALCLAGKGFLDTTRIAGGDGALWRDIFLDNRDNLRASLQRLQDRLGELQQMLDASRGDDLARWLDAAAGRRDALLKKKFGEMEM